MRNLLGKVRPNAIYLATLATIVAVLAINELVENSLLSDPQQSIVLVAAVAAVLGGLLTLAGQCATDPEPNPAIEITKVLLPVITAAVATAVADAVIVQKEDPHEETEEVEQT